jgi:hypothetical protein
MKMTKIEALKYAVAFFAGGLFMLTFYTDFMAKIFIALLIASILYLVFTLTNK